MFGLFAFRCDICGNIFRRSKYRWSIRGKKVWVCPTCNSKLERQKSKQAFDPDAELNLPDVRGRSSGCGGCLALIVGGSIIAAIVSSMTRTGTMTSSSDSAPTPVRSTPSSATPPPLTPVVAQRFATVAEAQQEAVRRYPNIGVAGSKLNTEFVARYKRYQQERPDFLRDPSWPLRLAEELVPPSTPVPTAARRPTQAETNAFIGLTEAQLIQRLGQPISAKTGTSPDGPFKMLEWDRTKGSETFFSIFADDGRVNYGYFRGIPTETK